MAQLSSSATLILRLFIPTIWIVFFGSFAVVGWMTSEDFVGPFQSSLVQDHHHLLCAHRVAPDPDFLLASAPRGCRSGTSFVSNYFRTYKYTQPALSHILIRHYGLFYLGRIELRMEGKLGKRIWFVPSRKRIEQFLRNNPSWMEMVKW
ncbi:MAG: hypothetical protein IPJ06_03600 [Saprospiraceae bacterium]|nr:hypothetical protein [Saprospiraceae bacterium]